LILNQKLTESLLFLDQISPHSVFLSHPYEIKFDTQGVFEDKELELEKTMGK